MLLVMTFSLCACRSDENDTAKNLNVEEKVSVNVWYTDESYNGYLEYVAKKFHEANELVTVVPVLVSGEDYVDTIYEQGIHKDNIADVYLVSAHELSKICKLGLAAQNNTYDKYYTEKKYTKTALKAASYNGKLYGYPVNFNTSFMVYNKSVVEPKDTFNALTEFSDNFQQTDENKNITQIITWDVSDMLLNYGFSAGSIQAGGEDGEDSSAINIDTERLKSAMNEVALLRDVYGIERSETTQDTCISMFTEGKLAYTIVDANHLKAIEDSDIEYGVCKIPTMGNDMEITNLSDTTLAVVNSYAGNLEVAKAVAHALSYDYSNAMFNTSGKISAKKVNIDKKVASTFGIIYDTYENSDIRAKFIGSANVYSGYEIMFRKIWDGEDAETAVDNYLSMLGIELNQQSSGEQSGDVIENTGAGADTDSKENVN